MTSDKEYDALRQELVQWQTRRFALVSASLILVVAALGWAHSSGQVCQSAWLSVIVLVYIAAAVLISAYCGIASAKLGAYLRVFHEECGSMSGWETRNSQLPRHASLNPHLALIYLTVGLVVAAFPSFLALVATPASLDSICLLPLAPFVLLLIPSLVHLRVSESRARTWFVEKYRVVRETETAEQSPPSDSGKAAADGGPLRSA